MPRLRLPPLPPVSTWRTHFPARVTAGSFKAVRSTPAAHTQTREIPGRLTLASQALCDQFVRDLGIRKDEVVIDAWSGMGQLTRSFLAGGYNETTAADWEQVEASTLQTRPPSTSAHDPDFPEWDVNVAEEPVLPKMSKAEMAAIVQPKLVVACDVHHPSLNRGLGFADELDVQERKKLMKVLFCGDSVYGDSQSVYTSKYEDRLRFATTSVYYWHALPNILSDPLVSPSLEVYDAKKTGAEATMRPWSAPPPPITVAATIPNSVLGDQVVNQWISSVIDSDKGGRSWLWKWGRVRLAVLVNKSLYDRMMAQPRETIFCKLSVLVHALFHVRPLPPYHHVPDVDKFSNRTAALPPTKKLNKVHRTYPAPPPTDQLTETCRRDFYEWNRGKGAEKQSDLALPHPRPLLLGIELIPRKDPIVKPEQREVWDYVLRKCFVRPASTVGEAIPKLAFGAENLLPRLYDTSDTFAGSPVGPDIPIRNMTVKQWARVADVFDKWAFKPTDLLISHTMTEDIREIGMSI